MKCTLYEYLSFNTKCELTLNPPYFTNIVSKIHYHIKTAKDYAEIWNEIRLLGFWFPLFFYDNMKRLLKVS